MVTHTAVAQAMDLPQALAAELMKEARAMGLPLPLPQAMAKQVLMEEVNQAMAKVDLRATKVKDTAVHQVKDMVDRATKIKDTADQVMAKDTVEDMERMEIIVI